MNTKELCLFSLGEFVKVQVLCAVTRGFIVEQVITVTKATTFIMYTIQYGNSTEMIEVLESDLILTQKMKIGVIA